MYLSHARPKILSLTPATLSHINDVIIEPSIIKSYLNQCFQVSQLLKYDGNIVSHREFQSHVLVEMRAPPNCFVWGLRSPVAKQWNEHKVKEVKVFCISKVWYFELRIFPFNPYIYYLTSGFIASTRALNLPTRAINLATRAFVLLTRRFERVPRRFELVTRIYDLVTCILLFHYFSTIVDWVYLHLL